MSLNLLDTLLKQIREDALRLIQPGRAESLPLVIDPFRVLAAYGEPNSQIVLARNAGERLPLFQATTWAFAWVIRAGPKEDGVTANAANIFIGGPRVVPAIGDLLIPGAERQSAAFSQVPVFDLSTVFVHFLNAGDAARVFYWG